MNLFLVGLLLYGTNTVNAEIWAYEKESGKSVGVFENEFIIFDFGRPSQFAAHLRMAEPPDACEPNFLPPPKLSEPTSWVLLATEGGCNLYTKIFNAQEAGYQSIIVMLDTEQAQVRNVNRKNNVAFKINVSFIGYIDGIKLKKFAYSQSSDIRHLIDVNYKKKVPPTPKLKLENQRKKEQPKLSYSTYNYDSHKTKKTEDNVEFKVLTCIVLFLVSITIIAAKRENYFLEQKEQQTKFRREQEQERKREQDHRRQQERNEEEQERESRRQQERDKEEQERENRRQQERDKEEQERQRERDQKKQYEPLLAHIVKSWAAKALLGFQRSDRPTRAEINTNFRRKSRSVHPDKFVGLPDSERKQKEEECKQLTEARTFLLENIV